MGFFELQFIVSVSMIWGVLLVEWSTVEHFTVWHGTRYELQSIASKAQRRPGSNPDIAPHLDAAALKGHLGSQDETPLLKP